MTGVAEQAVGADPLELACSPRDILRGRLNAGVRQREEARGVTAVRDRWEAGSTYEDFMGRWSRRLAPEFVSWLRVPRGLHWLDVGCGTGSRTQAICSHADPASVVGCDPANPFVEFARERSRDVRASFVAAGVGSLPRRPEGYGSVASLFALNFFPDPDAAVDEMRSITAPQGTVSACVWDYSDGMQFLRRFWDAAAAMDVAARELDHFLVEQVPLHHTSPHLTPTAARSSRRGSRRRCDQD